MTLLLVDILIVWRLTHLVQAEDGPFDLIFKLRSKIPSGSFWYSLFQCFYCLSVWFGMGEALIRIGWDIRVIGYGLALSGAAILLQFISGDK